MMNAIIFGLVCGVVMSLISWTQRKAIAEDIHKVLQQEFDDLIQRERLLMVAVQNQTKIELDNEDDIDNGEVK